jgi:hypothetical protein
MPRKRKSTGKRMNGKGIFSTLNNVAKETGIVSKGLSMIPVVGGVASTIARLFGYGKGKGKRGRGMPKRMTRVHPVKFQ